MDAELSITEPTLELDAAALRTNIRTLRKHVAADVNLCAVLKADAYGHGAWEIAHAICTVQQESPFLRIDQFAVATFEEAAELHEFGKPIMLLRPVENCFIGRQRQLIEAAIVNGWTMTISSATAADDIARIALHLQKRASVQIMLDTGMTRCGVQQTDFRHLLERTLHHPTLKLAALSTHLVNSEVAGDTYTSSQLRSFISEIEAYPIIESVPRHAANSGAIFFTPRSHFNVVRPGIALYGVDPTGRPCVDRPLKPVGKLVAPIIAIHEIQPGMTVGYGQSWVASERTRVGILPIGYADGYPRAAGNRGIVMIEDKKCGIVGRVSMDMIAINLNAAPDAIIGDAVTVIDSDPHSPASIYQLARTADTIPYEILTGIGKRVHRVLKGIDIPSTADTDLE